MKMILRTSYFVILGLVFLTNSAKALHLKGGCYILQQNIRKEIFLLKTLDRDACDYYYNLALLDFEYIKILRFFEGGKGYQKIIEHSKYFNYIIPVNFIPKTNKKKKAWTKKSFLEKYSRNR